MCGYVKDLYIYIYILNFFKNKNLITIIIKFNNYYFYYVTYVSVCVCKVIKETKVLDPSAYEGIL